MTMHQLLNSDAAIRPSARRTVKSIAMKDLSKLEEVSKRIADREAANAIDRVERDKLIAAARKDGYQWPRLADATQLGRQGVEAAARRGNGGVLPKPRQQA
jgi:hypothetical protein